MRTSSERLRIGIVGPCAAGKSTLMRLVNAPETVELRHIAQEHSYVQTMWQRISHPVFLIFLDVSYPVTMRRKNLNWTMDEYLEQQRRLQHARANADLIIDTDELTPEQVAEQVQAFITRHVR